jgi:LPS sulfotransferase NodH
VPDEVAWARRWQLDRAGHPVVNYRQFVRAALAEGTSDNGIFGARVMWGTLEAMVARLAGPDDGAISELDVVQRALGPTQFIHIWREDAVAQAVSWARADQTGYWQRGDAAYADPTYDFAQIDGLVNTVHEHNAAWRTWFHRLGVRPFRVPYEDLVADMHGTVRETLAFLGLDLPVSRRITPRHERQADSLNADWARRYRNDVALM